MTQVNVQPPEKKQHGNPFRIALHSIFYTIQGEGPFSGEPAIFIRLFGCNLQCPGCDTDYTSTKLTISPYEIARKAHELTPRTLQRSRPLVVITGGEPFRQDITMLVRALTDALFEVQIETNGSYYLSDFPYGHPHLTIVCSPKTGKVHPKLIPHIDAWKYVLDHEDVNHADNLPTRALRHPASPQIARPPDGALVYLQPMDTGDSVRDMRNAKLCARACMIHGYRLCLQTHKIVGLE